MKTSNFILIILFLSVALFDGILIARVFFSSVPVQSYRVDPMSVVPPDELLFESQISYAPSKEYYSYVTYRGYDLYDSKLWVMDVYGNTKSLLMHNESYSYLTNPVWSPDSKKLAILQVYPFKILVLDVENGTWTDNSKVINKILVYSNDPADGFVENEDAGILHPRLGYEGVSSLTWSGNEHIVFENTKVYPTEWYGVDVVSKELTLLPSGWSPYIDLLKIVDQEERGEVAFFSQRDDRWAGASLGGCVEDTIGSAGCAVTAVAMMLSEIDATVTPQSLDEYLTKDWEKGYFDGCQIRWNMIPFFSREIILLGAFFKTHDDDRIRYELDNRHSVIIGWDNVAFTDIPHWALVSRYDDESIYVYDPWTGKEKDLEYFGSAYDHMVVYEIRDETTR